MAKHNLKISFECPHCKQINDDVSLGSALYIIAAEKYIGTGEYVAVVDAVHIGCTGCQRDIEIEVE